MADDPTPRADRDPHLRTDPPANPDTLARTVFEVSVVALGAGAGAFLAWQAAGALLLVFAGLLFGVFLDAMARGLARVCGLARGWRLAIAVVVLAVLLGGGLAFGGMTVVGQAGQLADTLGGQLRGLRGDMADMGLDLGGRAPAPGGGEGADPGVGGFGGFARALLPDPAALVRSATVALSTVTGLLGNAVVVAFLGLYVAADPALYRRGVLLLLPRDRRARVGAVLDEAAETLRWWVLGQLVSMGAVATLTFAGLLAIGVPGAMLLALQAGLFAFIPYVGTAIGGAVIVLSALAGGPDAALWAFGHYVGVQGVESYVLTPLVQRRAVNLAPALVIGALVVLGALFGVPGLALGTPLLALLRLFVMRLWVADALGDEAGTRGAGASA